MCAGIAYLLVDKGMSSSVFSNLSLSHCEECIVAWRILIFTGRNKSNSHELLTFVVAIAYTKDLFV